MWNEITNSSDIVAFLQYTDMLHDGCIKEMKYESGAYVNENSFMHPVNDKRVLCVLVQRQSDEQPMVELVFSGLKYLRLYPANDNYTCEILDTSLVIKNNSIFWCDCAGFSAETIEEYTGTLICASKLCWRVIRKQIGANEAYCSVI